jgi:hypothetical protein
MRRPPSATRNDFRRDCDRIIHCTAFRRLAHKAQVFVSRISKIAFVRRAFDSCPGEASNLSRQSWADIVAKRFLVLE